MVVATATDICERKSAVLRLRRASTRAERLLIVAETRLPGESESTIAQRQGAAKSAIYQ